ncbi:cysteine proteinase inhibitor 1-like [Cicer arietinum]|uniref:Cysteine proteinase inhibitor 5-like n=1 Tax=Cicer arietinum TaxID=3827 RepID=A0A1S2Z8F7_CICAR|nr:cysteine proteinase inhibitor 5-like [Cicer arietinum]
MRHQFVVVLLFVVFVASMATRNQLIPGTWVPIKDLNDPHVTELANFAVTEHDKQTQSNLKFDKVIGGETKVVGGIKYCLNITTTGGIDFNKYTVTVLEKALLHFRNLTYFVPIRD